MRNLTSSRHSCRRQDERRGNSRRVIPYSFGSDEWLREIKASYLLWPIKDRRQHDRRDLNRRSIERRNVLKKHRQWYYHVSSNDPIRKQALTDEEKIMLAS